MRHVLVRETTDGWTVLAVEPALTEMQDQIHRQVMKSGVEGLILLREVPMRLSVSIELGDDGKESARVIESGKESARAVESGKESATAAKRGGNGAVDLERWIPLREAAAIRGCCPEELAPSGGLRIERCYAAGRAYLNRADFLEWNVQHPKRKSPTKRKSTAAAEPAPAADPEDHMTRLTAA